MKRTLKVLSFALAFIALFSVGGALTYKSLNTPVAVEAAVIRQGQRGDTVRTIQQKLKRWGYYKGAVDGIFGSQTKEAVKYFQRKNGLTVDGIVGNQTLKALGMSTSSSSGGSNYSDNDLYLLAKAIYAEAR